MTSPQQRFRRHRRCPVCGGCDDDPRGQTKRCYGFLGADGKYAHCSREDLAGPLEAEGGGTYAHRLEGPCRCGQTHGESTSDVRPSLREPEAIYPYVDELGALQFEVVRLPGKQFRQRAPDGSGGYVWKINGARRVLYRLPELLDDDGDRPVYVVEGEKDVETLRRHGLTATCNPGGAGKWHHVRDCAVSALAGRHVVVIADADDVGRKHAREVRSSLVGVAASVRVAECGPHKDVSDLYGAGKTIADLVWWPEPGAADASDAPFADDAAGAPATDAHAEPAHLVLPVPAQWWTERPAPRAWLLRDSRRSGSPGLLPVGKVGMLIAEGGAGKTMALFQLAVAVSTATRWLGTFDCAIPDSGGGVRSGRVLLVVGEEDCDECHRRCYRARAAAVTPEPATGSVGVIALAGVPCALLERDERANLRESAFCGRLRAEVVCGGWDLVIVDPLSRFAGPDAEVDSAAATRFVQLLESLTCGGRTTVLVAHHTNKLSRRGGAVDASAGRGSSALVDGVRWQCSLGVERLELEDEAERERLGEVVTWAHSKSNYSRRAEPVLLRRAVEYGGALLSLDAGDEQTVLSARGRAQPQEQRREAARRHEQERAAREDAALDAILSSADAPVGARELRACLRARLGSCSSDRADACLARRRRRTEIT